MLHPPKKSAFFNFFKICDFLFFQKHFGKSKYFSSLKKIFRNWTQLNERSSKTSLLGVEDDFFFSKKAFLFSGPPPKKIWLIEFENQLTTFQELTGLSHQLIGISA